jgi:hypothetical protein
MMDARRSLKILLDYFKEAGIHQAESAGVAGSTIDDDDFPMQPQIRPHLEHTDRADWISCPNFISSILSSGQSLCSFDFVQSEQKLHYWLFFPASYPFP